ncbi:S8 family serine peptidase [Streptomyces sp. NPDC059524]|uniref:S8 family serine peptidase n=1 Tax=Streptomyces sp. NPDC059524 TaxID=3346856 RepID=UPI003675F11D
MNPISATRSRTSPRAGRRSARPATGRTVTCLIASGVLGGLLAGPAATAAPVKDPDRRVIVTLAGPAPVAGKGRLDRADRADVLGERGELKAEQGRFLDALEEAGVEVRAPRRLNLLLNAVAVTVKASQVADLKRQPGVTGVVEDKKLRIQTDDSVPTIGAPRVWQREDAHGTKVRGDGVTVAVLDSGIDYTHPDLGGGFGAGHKVVGGYDFADDDTDPMDDNGHGTHVAGIIAGEAAQPGGVTGVAPGASLTAYKVMGADGYGETSDIVAGLEAAVDPANPHRADVVNMSIGGPGDGGDPIGLAATAATRAGVVVVASAGNEGPGHNTVGSPAAADGVLAVGASVSGLRVPGAAYKGGGKIQTYRGYVSANPPAKPVTLELADVGYGSPDEWDAAGDVHGKAVRVQYPVSEDVGDVSVQELDLAREAEKRGAVAILGGTANSGPVLAGERRGFVEAAPRAAIDASGDSLRMDHVIVMGVDDTQYDELGRRLADGEVEITVTGEDATDRMAGFSSRGPDAGWDLKPDLVAPGYDIRSTVPKSLYAPGQYRMSGTSMAAPHVAGAAALLRQLHPDHGPARVTSELTGSSKELPDFDTATVGAGRLDVAAAADAADAGITTSPATLSYGLADLKDRQIGGSRALTVHNDGDKPRAVRLTASGDARVSPRTLTVPAGGSARATVTVRAERPSHDTEISGQVTLAPEGAPALHVPYLLSVRTLFAQAGPDPGDGKSGVAVFAPVGLKSAPTVTVRPPHGRAFTARTKHRSGNVYEVQLSVRDEGAYRISARAETTDGKTLTSNSDGFEVTPKSSRGERWQPVGPSSAAGDLTLAPGAPGHAVLDRADSTGLWATDDNGRTWRQTARLPVTDVTGDGHLVIDPEDENRWWYAVNSASGFPRTGQILRTEDAGRTWRRLDTPGDPVSGLLADDRTGTLIAWTGAGLLLSRDGGTHWATAPLDVPGDVYDVKAAGDSLYYATGHAVWKRDGLASGTLGAPRKVYEPKGGRTVTRVVAEGDFVGGYENGTGVVGSRDGGTTWSTLLDAWLGVSGLTITGGDLYVATRDGIRVGRDLGRDWSLIKAPGDFVALDFDRWADGSLTVSASGAGLYRTRDDGAHYERIGVQGGTVNGLEVSGRTLLAAGPVGTHRTALPARDPDWGTTGGEGTLGNETALLKVSAQDENVVWRVRRGPWGDFAVERSTDGGRAWEEKGHGEGTVFALEVHPADPDQVYVAYGSIRSQGLYATRDGGEHWKNLRQDTHLTALAGDPSDPDTLWLGAPDGLYRSGDRGEEMTKRADGKVTAIRFAGGRLLAGGDAIRTSTDGGRTFRTGDTGGLPVLITDFERIGDTLYAGSGAFWETALPRGGRGVLRSTDGGRTWHNVSTGLQNLDVTQLATDGEDLYAGTTLGGVHRLDLTG